MGPHGNFGKQSGADLFQAVLELSLAIIWSSDLILTWARTGIGNK